MDSTMTHFFLWEGRWQETDFQLLMKLFHLLGNTSAKKWWEAGYDIPLILPFLHLHKIQAVRHRLLGYVAGIHLSSRAFLRIKVLGQINPWDNSIVFCLRKYQLLWTEGWSHDESKWMTGNHNWDLGQVPLLLQSSHINRINQHKCQLPPHLPM